MGDNLIIVIGAGGHAKVVISTLRALGHTQLLCFDDDPARHNTLVLGVPVRGAIAEAREIACAGAVIAIGTDSVRRSLSALDLPWISVVHPSAVVDPSAKIGRGTVVFAGCVVQPDATIGEHVIVNTMASVDHDSVVDDFAQLCPGVRLAGAVQIGEEAFLGTGAVVAPGVKIGARAVLGAGGVLLHDLAAGARAFGVPARPKKSQ